MRFLPALLAALFLVPAAAQAQAPAAGDKPAEKAKENAKAAPPAPVKANEPVPEKWHAAMQKQMQAGQKLVQTLTGDIDNDGKAEWIAVSEPTAKRAEYVTLAIFEPAQGKNPPKLRFSQWLKADGAQRAGAIVKPVAPLGNAVVLVASTLSRSGDNQFTAQIYAWNGKTFRPMVPEIINFRSQGGFSIEDLDPSTKGDEIVAWTFLPGENEQLFDLHRYAWQVYKWDGIRFVGPDRESQTDEKLANPEAAGRFVGSKKGDLRRQMPRVAEVP